MNYLDRLSALLNKFSQEEIAELLNVTERSIQFWTSSENSKVPHPKKQRDITDLYDSLITNELSIEEYKSIMGPKSRLINNNNNFEGVPIYDVPIDAGFLERYRDEDYNPLYFLKIPKLRNCNFGAIVSGSSMYPIMKSGSIAMCRIVEDLNYIDPGEMYLISTTNGFETVKYVQPGDKKDELRLIPHNEKIKPTSIKKSMIIRMCIVEAWINFR